MTSHATHAMGNRRHRRYIKRSFQRRFIIQVGLLMMLGCAAFGAVVYLYGTRTITTAFVHSKLRVMSTGEFLLPALAICTLAVAGAVAVLAAGRLLFLSHRIAGPLYRFERTAQAIGNGDLSGEVRLRDGDELQDLARSMGGMVTDLRVRVQDVQTHSRRLGELIAQAKQRPDAPQELLAALEDSQGRLDEAISRFRV